MILIKMTLFGFLFSCRKLYFFFQNVLIIIFLKIAENERKVENLEKKLLEVEEKLKRSEKLASSKKEKLLKLEKEVINFF